MIGRMLALAVDIDLARRPHIDRQCRPYLTRRFAAGVFSVLASSKRRASFYTLPIVVVIGFGLVAGLAAWQRADVIAELADQVARGEKSEATAAVRQLAAIPNPPLSVLVEAAAADERATAEAAQVAINRIMGQWQRQVDKQQRLSSVASGLTELAGALAEQRDAFAPADYPWLASVTRKIVRLANKYPAKKTPLVAMHCDSIMSVVNGANPTREAIAGTAAPSDDGRQHAAAATADQTDSRESQRARLEHEFSAFPTQPIATGADAGTELPAANATTPTQPLPEDDAGLQPGKNSLRNDGLDFQRPSEIAQGDSQSGNLLFGQMPSLDELGGRPGWSLPIFRILPAAPIHSKASDNGRPGAKEMNSLPSSAAVETAALGTRELLGRWQDTSNDERREIERTLAARGFQRLPEKLVRQYLSTDLENRLHVVDSVLTQPGVDARPWLFLLAEDENAEVRLLAVTVMATSDDQALVEKAWQVSIHDRDPRIADLAGRLRDRRAGTLPR
jgi:hypothetical protein